MRIFLAGVSCVGKTTVGAHLAALRGVPFFDLDIEVEQFFQRPIAQIQAECLTMDSYRRRTADLCVDIAGLGPDEAAASVNDILSHFDEAKTARSG